MDTELNSSQTYNMSSANSSGRNQSVELDNNDVTTENNSKDVKRETPNQFQDEKLPKKRKKVSMACIYCRRSHMNCDESRPCKRCIKRNIGHLCHDTTKQKPSSPLADAPINSNTSTSVLNTVLSPQTIKTPNPTDLIHDNNFNNNIGNKTNNVLQSSVTINQLPFFYSEHAGSEFNSLTEFLSMIDDNDMMDSINLSNDPLLQKLEATNYISSSNNLAAMNNAPLPNADQNLSKMSHQQLNVLQLQLNQQQKALQQHYQQNGIVDPQHRIESNQLMNNDTHIHDNTQSFTNQLSNSLLEPSNQIITSYKTPNQQNAQLSYQKSPVLSRNNPNVSSMPHISDAARDKFFLTAADPTTEISPEERLKQVINAKLEAGLLQPYNYAKGYQRLQTYMDNYMSSSSRSRILKPLSTFRPGFRAIAKTLKDIDLILVEESFERMLLDYDRVFTSMAIPACLWRRTGEIYRGNKEFASLVNVSIEDLKNGKLTIYELMTEESSVNFWEKYGAIAFDKTQKAVLTSCNLRTRDGRKKKNCCFSFTIRRDRYNIPSCIVGNFIPIR
ncbi:Rds2 protein [Pichia kluyveri]|uniref:Rds2 protein n=1 Tax=Pichia kluyveri TaxID=36015 RepID=A0AAV5QZW8_PICKL|nr:Rds2 protein [Pichia kluyveri]